MARVKSGVVTRRRHKKLLKSNSGYRHGRKNLYRRAKQAFLKAGVNRYKSRRLKKRTFRSLWIVRIKAALADSGMTYSQFINKLKKNKIELDRKSLADLAANHPAEFSKIVAQVKE